MSNNTNANDDTKNNYSNAEENDQEDITDVVTEVEKPELEVENSQIVNENAIENQSSDDKGKIFFSNFFCRFTFWIPIVFSNMNMNCSFVIDLSNFQ